MSQCLILNYHSVYTSTDDKEYDPVYSINKKVLEAQFKLIYESGLEVCCISEIHRCKKKNVVAITFDDGYESDYAIVYPLLLKYKLKASFFLTIEEINKTPERWNDYSEMKKNGNYIGPHGMSHRDFSGLNSKEQFYEIHNSHKIILDKLNHDSKIYALPEGRYNNQTLEILKSLDFRGVLSTEFGLCTLGDIPFLIKRCTIRKNTTISEFRKLITFDSKYINRNISLSKVKKRIQHILGSKLSNKINYLFK